MFALRRVAVRALQHQPTHQLRSLRSVSLTSRLESIKPSQCRSFHQSRPWLAEEQQKEAEEDSALAQATEQAKDIAQSAKDALTGAAASVTNAVSSDESRFPGDTSKKVIYIGNLFFEVTTAELETEFGHIGQIVKSRIVSDDRGLSRGFGYIEFSTEEAADQAIREMDQKLFQGRRMAVQLHQRRDRSASGGSLNRPRRDPAVPAPPSKTLFIGNMSYQMSDRDLNDLFREVQNVTDVRVAIDRRSGQPRGFAHADFTDIASAEKAREHLVSKMVYGRQLRVDFSAGNPAGQKA